MTDLTQGQDQSAFNSRADNAALRLKGDLSQQLSAIAGHQVELPPSPVQVGPDGQPAGPLPPDGSYARDQISQQQQAAAQQQQQMAHLQATDPAAHAQQVAPPAPPPQQAPELSPRAEERIQTLVERLRLKDEDQAKFAQQQAAQATTIEQLQQQLQGRDQQLQSLMSEHMENLDPETRQQILNSAQIKEAVAQSESRIMQQMAPQLRSLQLGREQQDKAALGDMFGGLYDPMKHDHLIDAARKQNPNTSVRMAFQAILTPEEIATGAGRRAIPVPPSVPPGNGPVSPRFMPPQAGREDPLTAMRADANKAAELARSSDPNDQKLSQQMFHQNIKERLGMADPG